MTYSSLDPQAATVAHNLDMAEKPLPRNVLQRHRAILDLAQLTGSVSVDELALRFAVTPQTVRRDLNLLAQGSMLSRIHGGAIVTSGTGNIAYEDRQNVASPAKYSIGVAAAALVPDGASLFINIGTTAEAVAAQLRYHRDLLVISNNLNVVDLLRDSESIDTMVVGGRVRQSDRAVVGPQAMAFIRNFKVDIAVIGASAIDRDGSLLDFDEHEVLVTQTIMENSRKIILVADSSKIARAAPVRIGHISAVQHFVTDIIDDELRAICATARVEINETGIAS